MSVVLCSILYWMCPLPQFTVIDNSILKIETPQDGSCQSKEEFVLNLVWNIISSFNDYGKWNTFTTDVFTRQPPVLGESVTLNVVMHYPWPIHIFDNTSEIILTLDTFQLLQFDQASRRICWGIRNSKSGMTTLWSIVLDSLLISNRCMEASAIRSSNPLDHPSNESSSVDQQIDKSNTSYSFCEQDTTTADEHLIHHIDVLFSQWDENIGWMSPLVKLMFEDPIERGFRRMSADLSVRVLSR